MPQRCKQDLPRQMVGRMPATFASRCKHSANGLLATLRHGATRAAISTGEKAQVRRHFRILAARADTLRHTGIYPLP